MSHRTINLDNAELIGHVGVDSGQMMLVDPCYIKSFDSDDGEFASDAMGRETPEHTNFSYAGACNVTLAKKQAGTLDRGTAAVCSSGFGDGSYPVYVEFSDEGSWGRRVKSMTIVFIENDEGTDEDPIEVCENCGDEMWGFHNGEVCPDCEANANDEDDES